MDLKEWTENKYLDYQKEHGRLSMRKWAQTLGLSHGYISNMMNGITTSISMKIAYQIGERLGDFSILEVLGYPVPDAPLVGFTEEEKAAILDFLGRVKEAVENVPDSERLEIIKAMLPSSND